MIITTTGQVEGYRVAQYLGIVTGESVSGTAFFRDWFAGIRDVFGGRSATYQNIYRSCAEQALEDMQKAAAERGADAVIGVVLQAGDLTADTKQMLTTIASGTAVKLAKV
jgi:uncharacterized protein YbjQ (UPF0145 family)